jgi:hypothetical protein
MDMATLAGELTTDALAAELDEQAGLQSLLLIAGQVGSPFAGATSDMIKPLFDLSRSGPENPEGLYNLAKTIERLAAAGIGISELPWISSDASALRTIEQAAKWGKAGLDLAQLRETGMVNARRFTDDVLSALPPAIAPALASPAGKLFRDLMDWDQQMWSTSTDGLNLVSQAITTGKLDMAAYNKVAMRLQMLGQQGPWTTQSGIDFAKKMAEMVPGGGKLLKALWGGSSTSPPAPAGLAPGKYVGGLSVHDLSACEEFGFGSLNSPPGNTATKAFLTVTSTGATLVLEEEGSTRSADYFETSDGSLSISPDHVVVGVRHKTTYFFDMTIAKSTTGDYVGSGTFIIQDNCEQQAPAYQATLSLSPAPS